VKQTLLQLVDLQSIDDALRDLRESLARLVAVEKENAESLVGFDAILQGLSDRIAETQRFMREKEDEVREIDANLQRSKQRMTGVQNNRELMALNKELESSRNANRLRTEELVRLQEILTKAEADHAQKQRERDALSVDMVALAQSLREEIAQKEAGLETLNARRVEVRATLSRELIARYDRISKGRNGLAVVGVPNGTCGGCNMAVPPQVFIRLQRLETLEACANCIRLLVYMPALLAEHTPVALPNPNLAGLSE
jgi:predicted  nucleic acid-binding Zn-ribbon protein